MNLLITFWQSVYLRIQAGARYLHFSDLRAVLEEAGHVVERREDHDEDDEVSGANVEPVNGLNMHENGVMCMNDF